MPSASEASRGVEAISEIMSAWRHNRSLYPGWPVLPHQNRDNTWEKTRFWIPDIIFHLKDVDRQTRAAWLYELAWRWDACLLPWPQTLMEAVQQLLAEYADPAEVGIRDDSVPGRENQYLLLGLVRFFREVQDASSFSESAQRAASSTTTDSEVQAFVQYQRVLFALENWEFTAALGIAKQDWSSIDPIWKSRQASVLAELGELRDARSLAVVALQETRVTATGKDPSNKREGNSIFSKINSYSREGIARQCLQFIDTATSVRDLSWIPSGPDGRWEELGLYRANAQAEFQIAEDRISTVPRKRGQAAKPASHSLSRRNSIYFSVDDEPYAASRGALEFPRFLEQSAIPPTIDSLIIARDPLLEAHGRLLEHFPACALRLAFRVRSPELFEKSLSIARVATATRDEIVSLNSRAYITVERTPPSSRALQAANGFSRVIESTQECALAIAIQISPRLKVDDRLQWVRFLRQMISHHPLHDFVRIRKAARLLEALVRDTRPSEMATLSTEVLMIPFREGDMQLSSTLTHVYDLFGEPQSVALSDQWPEISLEWIGQLRTEAASPTSRRALLLRLLALRNSGMLSQERQNQLDDVLGSSSIWPTWNVSPQLVLGLVTNDKKEMLSNAFYKHLPNLEIGTMRSSSKGWAFQSFSSGELLTTLAYAFPRPWSDQPYGPLSSTSIPEDVRKAVVTKFISWWREEGRDIAAQSIRRQFSDFFFDRLRTATNVLAYVLLPACREINSERSELAGIVTEMRTLGLPSEHVAPALAAYTDEIDVNAAASVIRSSISSTDNGHATASIEGILHWCAIHARGDLAAVPLDLLREVGLIIRSRNPGPLLAVALDIVDIIARQYPSEIEPMFADIVVGLNYLEGETSYKVMLVQDRVSDEELLSLRRRASSLVSLLATLKRPGSAGETLAIVANAWSEVLLTDSLLGDAR